MNKILLLLLTVVIAGCNSHTDGNGITHIGVGNINKEELPAVDQCMRANLFQQCMKALPAGPAATKYNDWDEVVHACSSTSRNMSLRKLKTIKEECRVE